MASLILSGCTWVATRSRPRSPTPTESSPSFISPWRSIISSRCRSARLCAESSSSRSRIKPWLMLPPSRDNPDSMHNRFYDLQSKEEIRVHGEEAADFYTVIIGSSHGWVALYKRRSRRMFLWNPLTHACIDLPRPLNLDLPHPLPHPLPLYLESGIAVPSKIILSCSPDDVGGRCRAVMIYCPLERLAVCCPGVSKEWTPIGSVYELIDVSITKRETLSCTYEDLAFSGNQLFCITKWWTVECWDIGGENEINKLAWSHYYDPDTEADPDLILTKYVVVPEQSGEVLVVLRKICLESCKTLGFHVYNADGHDLIHKKTLDGLAIFIGINHSFALDTADYPDLKPNSIYFACPTPSRFNYGGVYSYQDGKFSSCYYSPKFFCMDPPPAWFTPNAPCLNYSGKYFFD